MGREELMTDVRKQSTELLWEEEHKGCQRRHIQIFIHLTGAE